MPEPTLITFSFEQFIILMIAIVAATGSIIKWIDYRTTKIKKQIEKQIEKQIDEIKKDLNEHDNRIRSIEINLNARIGAIDIRLENIRESIKEFKTSK